MQDRADGTTVDTEQAAQLVGRCARDVLVYQHLDLVLIELPCPPRGTCGYGVIFDGPVEALGRADMKDYEHWVWEHDGAETGPEAKRDGRVLLSIRGNGPSPVLLTGLAIEIVDRKPGPLVGTVVGGGCGGETMGPLAEVDLDSNPPKIIRTNADPDGLLSGEEGVWSKDGYNAKPLAFPYKVSDTDPELLLIIAEAHTPDTVSYRLKLSWSDGSNSGTEIIDNHGKPFRLAATGTGSPVYRPELWPEETAGIPTKVR
ncbi:hypothetical protein [Nocardia sp. NPDC052112]|uniref:hypothetical protein n=1 Tax=Nocardia sp. NPDC052112 TaxID=3155646 RepID=UPI00343DABA7